MKHKPYLFVVLLSIVMQHLAACSPGPVGSDGDVALERSATFPLFATVLKSLPPLSEGQIRLYVYRPQSIRARYANPVVVVDGHYLVLGDLKKGRIPQTRLRSGSVFIVDTSSGQPSIWLYTEEYGDDLKRKFSLSAKDGRVRYLRWVPGFRYHFFETVSEQEAMREIGALVFTGHVRW